MMPLWAEYQYCIVPGCDRLATDQAHWPRTKAVGGRWTVPLCHSCHMAQHVGDRKVITRLWGAGEVYYKAKQLWDVVQPDYRAYENRWRTRVGLPDGGADE